MKRSINIILNQTNFTPREGVFDLSVFPLDNEFEVKIGKKRSNPPGYARPPYPGAQHGLVFWYSL